MTLREWLLKEVSALVEGGDVVDCGRAGCAFAGRTLVPETGAAAMAAYLARRLVAEGIVDKARAADIGK